MKNCAMQASGMPVRNQHSPLPAGRPVPMWNLLLGWVILIPLLFFATNGAVVPDTGDVAFRAVEAGGSSLSHRLGLAVIVPLCSVLIFTRLPTIFAMGQRTKLIVALPILALLSSAWSESARQTLVSGTILFVFTLFALYIASSFEPSGQFELLMLAGGVALVLSIGLVLFVPALGAPGHSWRGIFAHKQNCAAVSTLLLVTAIHWRASGIYQKVFRASYEVMCCTMIVMSQSRTGWALAILAVGLSATLWLLQKMTPKEALFVALFVAAAFGGVAYVVYDHAAVLLPAVGKDPTLSERTIIWAAVWTTIAKQPILGYGYGAFWTGLQGPSLNIVLISGWVLSQAQNGLLDLWLQVGIAGVFLILLATAQAFRNAVRCFRASGHDRYVRWCIVVIACTLVFNIGESSLGMVHLVWFLFLLACIGLKQRAMGEHAEAISDGEPHFLAP
jgi:exopolysaccharide production protein ExoQ